jgi:hypothetical protein
MQPKMLAMLIVAVCSLVRLPCLTLMELVCSLFPFVFLIRHPNLAESQGALAFEQPTQDVIIDVDWVEFMARNDLIWNWNPTSPLPDTWDQSSFHGNGALGLMIFVNSTIPTKVIYLSNLKGSTCALV